MILTDYQVLVIICGVLMDSVCAWIIIFFCYAVVNYSEFRTGLVEAIQNGDKVFHWMDAKRFGSFVAGGINAMFTMNITCIFVYEKMFELGPLGFVGFFTAVTFTLWGIAWKR